MKVYLIILIPVLVFCYSGFEEQDVMKKEYTIDLNSIEGLYLSDILKVRLLKNNHLFVLDELTMKLYLVNYPQMQFKEINISKKYPGAPWLPLAMAVDKDDNLYIHTSDHTGNIYVFNNHGLLIKVINNELFIKILNFIVTRNNEIVTYLSYTENFKAEIVKFSEDGELICRFGLFQDNMPGIIYRFTENNGLVEDNDYNLYQLNASSEKIHKFTALGDHISSFKRTPKFYNPVKKDIPLVLNNRKKLKDVMAVISESTLPLSLFRVNNLFLILFKLKNGYGIDIFDGDGNYYTNGNVIIKEKIIDIRDDKIVQISMPDQKEGKDEIPNPVLKISTLRELKVFIKGENVEL